jgi:pimeloyl-ACP methyl ester carboxylesterase
MLPALTRLALEELGLAAGGIGEIHRAVADRAFAKGGTAKLLHDGISGAVYGGLKGGATLAGRAASAVVPEREVPPALLAILNGLQGDVLEPPLAMPMTLSVEGDDPRLAVFVHGLFETEHAWRYGGGPRYGDRLPGWTPVYVRYNTGRRISDNGRTLAAELETVVAERDVEEIALIGHSMGGLVARSACHHGGDWTRLVTHVISLGTPHTGAPLESAVHYAAAALGVLPESRPFSRFLRRRSGGIRDLRSGSLVDEDWKDRDPEALRAVACREVPLLDGARHCFVAATVTRRADHPVGRLVGDWLVLERSASHRTQEALHVGAAHHLALLNHPAVYERLAAQLG